MKTYINKASYDSHKRLKTIYTILRTIFFDAIKMINIVNQIIVYNQVTLNSAVST